MSDGFVFNDGTVKVGNGILWVAGTTYPLRAINSLRAVATDNTIVRFGGLGLVVVALILALQGDKDALVTAPFVAILGLCLFFFVKDQFKLFVNTMGGEKQVLLSKDKQYVKTVRDCIEACIANETRGTSAGHPMHTINGSAGDSAGRLPRA